MFTTFMFGFVTFSREHVAYPNRWIDRQFKMVPETRSGN